MLFILCFPRIGKIKYISLTVRSTINTQNVPQLFLQSLYIASSDGLNDGIAIASIVFSIVSIIVSVLSMTMEKTINFTQSYTIITMEITGDCVRKKAKKCRTMSSKLKQQLSLLMGIESNTMEIMKPTNIQNGFRLKMHIYVNERLERQTDFKNILRDANDSNDLSAIFQEAWELSNNPKISNIHSLVVRSQEEQLNASNFGVQMHDARTNVAFNSHHVPNTSYNQ